MSSKRGNKSVSIRVEDDVRQWIDLLKDHYGAQNVSDVLRIVIKRAHPNIDVATRQYFELLAAQLGAEDMEQEEL